MGIEPIYAMAGGVMLGGLLQLVAQIPALHRLGLLPSIRSGLVRIARGLGRPGRTGRWLA
jgi:putative peptidoglycan lipid II flippase